jgi:regulatory protein
MTQQQSDYDYILNKARHFCDYQERCIQDLVLKLQSWKIKKEVMERVIEKLIHEGFINEERYARLFAGGKFRNLHWGKNKIIHELQRRNIPDLIIQIGLKEIEDEDVDNTLAELLIKKSRELSKETPRTRKNKLITFAYGKGYPFDQISKVLSSNSSVLKI